MGIAVTVVVVVALLFVAGAALEDYAAEVRESPKTVQGNSSRDSLFRIDEGSCGTIQHGHAGCHTDSGCADARHAGYDAAGRGPAKRAMARSADITDREHFIASDITPTPL